VKLDGDRMVVKGDSLNEQDCVASASDIKVQLAGADCAVSKDSSIDSGEFECTLAHKPKVGEYRATVTGLCGDFDNSGTDLFSVELEIDSVEPRSDLNPLGGNELHIRGSGFSEDANEVSATFNDGTECKILKTSATEITCRTGRFDQDNLKDEYTLTIDVDG
jgi:hypothetical protein